MKLIAVTNDKMSTVELAETIIATEPYIDAVILREKMKTDIEVINLIQKLVGSGVNQSKLIVHGRADIATLCGINKVQLPGHGAPLPLIKEHFPDLSFGRSVHSYDEAEIAVKAGASWLLYGHLFETNSKEGLPPRGTEELSRIIESVAVPVYAIGGINPKHLSELQLAGVSGVAIMSSIFGSDDSVNAVKAYKEALHHVTKS